MFHALTKLNLQRSISHSTAFALEAWLHQAVTNYNTDLRPYQTCRIKAWYEEGFVSKTSGSSILVVMQLDLQFRDSATEVQISECMGSCLIQNDGDWPGPYLLSLSLSDYK